MKAAGALFICLVLLFPSFASAGTAMASWYGPGFNGRRMACGGIFRSENVTIVAHKSLPCGTKVWFTNPATGMTALGIVQDRGPYVGKREYDLSQGLARTLGYEREGIATLEVGYTDPAAPAAPGDGWTPADDLGIPVS